LAVYLADIVLSVRSAIQIGDRLAKLHAIHDELAGRLEQLRQEPREALEAQRQRMEAAVASARQTAEQKLHALYSRQDYFERRLLRAFPTMRSVRHPEAMKKLREYLAERRR
jgi:uncharacterized membrane protein